jgi:hypothetical protein
MDKVTMVALSGLAHGRGIDRQALQQALSYDPDFVGIDTGSTDPGPYWLGSGENQYPSRAVVTEILRTLLSEVRKADVPLIIGSAATAGAQPHVDWLGEVVREVSAEEGLSYQLGTIYSDVGPTYLEEKVEDGETTPLDDAQALAPETIDSAEHVVANMGPEPMVEALDRGADVVLAGRASDVSIFSAIPIAEGLDAGLAMHLAKTVECGGMVIKPDRGLVIGEVTDDYFRVRPADPEKYTDPLTIASHLLYESANPYVFTEPLGTFDTRECTYEQIDDNAVEVRNTKFSPADQYTVKLEGAREVGHRCVAMNGIRDPLLVDQIDHVLADSEEWIEGKADEMGLVDEEYHVTVNVYGKNAVMGDREPTPAPGHEVGVFTDVVAPTADDAFALSHLLSAHMLHGTFPGRKCTAGNTATATSPGNVSGEKAYEFNIWHTIAVDDPLEPFEIHVDALGEDEAVAAGGETR